MAKKRKTALNRERERSAYWQDQAERARLAIDMIALMLTREQLQTVCDASVLTALRRRDLKREDS